MTTGSPWRVPTAASSWPTCVAPTGDSCVHGRHRRSRPTAAAPTTSLYAEDYGALLEALLTLAEVDDVAWLAEARTVADGLIELFHDDEHGGFFTTGSDAERLIVRPRDYQDNATPAENSLAANGLLRLAALTGDSRYEQPAARVLARLAPVLGEHPTAFAYLLGALERLVTPPLEVAIIGDPHDPNTSLLRTEAYARLLPASVALTATPGTGGELTPLLADRPLLDGTATAYVCESFACRLPVNAPDELRARSSMRCLRRVGRSKRRAQWRGPARPSASCSAIAQP